MLHFFYKTAISAAKNIFLLQILDKSEKKSV